MQGRDRSNRKSRRLEQVHEPACQTRLVASGLPNGVRICVTDHASLKIKLTRTVRGFSGSPYPKGSVLEVRIARDGMLEVAGAQHLPLHPHEWELVLTDEDLERLLGA